MYHHRDDFEKIETIGFYTKTHGIQVKLHCSAHEENLVDQLSIKKLISTDITSCSIYYSGSERVKYKNSDQFKIIFDQAANPSMSSNQVTLGPRIFKGSDSKIVGYKSTMRIRFSGSIQSTSWTQINSSLAPGSGL